MAFSIAMAGKGGTGKTTVAGLLIRYLVETGRKPVLAVDADANSNLNEVLGVEVFETLGHAREEMKKHVSVGMTKDVFMEMKLQQAVVEGSGFDLIVMGRPEGPGCYCAANTLLSQYLGKLIGNYPYIVIDNEAGMEHMSRLTTNNVDVLLVVSDPSRRGLEAAKRIWELAKELKLDVGRGFLLVNRVKDGEGLGDVSNLTRLELLGVLHEDNTIQEYDLKGMPTSKVPPESAIIKESYRVFEGIFR
ncbi:MAG: AAA family ATPase [Desulfatiglandales bacterium]